MSTPSFQMMWQAFPDHATYPTLRDLHGFIGGALVKNIDVPGFGPAGNTCAVRMSRALNYGNFPVSAELVRKLGISAMVGADGMLYLFRVRELKRYLKCALGSTPIRGTNDFDLAFRNQQGIVAFDVKGWNDASGHVALWDGSGFREAHDNYRKLRDNPATERVEPTTTAMSLWVV